MSRMLGQPGTGWTVSSQREETKLDDSGGAVEGKTVTFRTQYGATGSVFLPRTQYTVDNVRDAINATAAEMDLVHTLTG